MKYVPVQWNANKWMYDAILVAVITAYILIFLRLGTPAADIARPLSGAIVRMRAFGSAAFLMLTLILCIGPLARLDKRFLPILYNRRHFGVLTAVVAFTHASYVLGWYFAYSPTPTLLALLTSNTSYGQILGFPFESFGVAALLILAVLAATSHDFWLTFLSAPVWKSLHLLIYPAYIFVVAHVALGYYQDARDPAFAVIFFSGALAVAGLHAAAWLKERHLKLTTGRWIKACRPHDIADKRAVIVAITKQHRVAIFRNGDSYSAVSNTCAHQGGPLGEGKIVYGMVTCPWHGFSYKPCNGRAPAPFTEKIPTYNIKLEGGFLHIDSEANQPGTEVDPVIYPPTTCEGGDDDQS